MKWRGLLGAGWLGWAVSLAGQSHPLSYAPAPVDNPLKGLVPYANQAGTNFPCSMEYSYLPLKDVVKGVGEYDWQPLERLLDEIASRGRQAVFRFYLDYPGQACAVPDYLLQTGLKVTRWNSSSASGDPCFSPDYEDPRLRECLTNFIAVLGRKYDGDPRVGFITAGLLGLWGEWHTSPRGDLWAGKTAQAEILAAYERAFKTTRVLLRYPAGLGHREYAPNADRAFGYHDDSFAYATLADAGPSHGWYFLKLMAAAGALGKWKSQPIGGEVRPEIWGCCYDEPGCEPAGQAFADCVEQTHVTWLMDSGAFTQPMTPSRFAKAARLVRRMGYEFYVEKVGIHVGGQGAMDVSLWLENRGVAPFYYRWPVELAALDPTGRIAATWRTTWDLTELASGTGARPWRRKIERGHLPPGDYKLLLRVVNPLPNGRSLGFANAAQNADKLGWLTLVEFNQPKKKR